MTNRQMAEIWGRSAARALVTFKRLNTRHLNAASKGWHFGQPGRFAVGSAAVTAIGDARRAAHFANLVLDEKGGL